MIALYLPHVSPLSAGRGCWSWADRCDAAMTQLVSPDQSWAQEVELVTSAGISHDTSYTHTVNSDVMFVLSVLII